MPLSRRWSLALRAIRVLLGAVLLTTCSTDSALAPRTRVQSRFDASALFQAGGAFDIPIDEVDLELRRVSDNSIAFSRTLTAAEYSSSGGQLVIEISLDLESSPEDFNFLAIVKSGGTEYYRATGTVTATAGQTSSTSPITPAYTGPGGAADQITFAQSTTLGDAQTATLSAVVSQGGTPLTGVPVAFTSSDTTLIRPVATGIDKASITAPASGSGSVTITATTPTGLTASGTVAWAPTAGVLVKVSGDQQSVPVGTAAAAPLVVELRDGQGAPLPGGSVAFTVTAGPSGTSVAPTTAITDSVGRAQTTLTAGSPAGSITVTATVQGVTPVSFTATATQPVGPAASVTAVSAATQNVVVNQLATAPSVVVRDANAQPVPNATVTFAVTAGGGLLTGPSQLTNASGIATVGTWRVGQAAGTNTVTATVGTLTPATFTATGTPTVPLTVAKDSGDAQTGVASTALPTPLVVQVRDSFANVVPGATVTWAATAGGGSVVPTSGTTNASGRSRTTWTLGPNGTQTASATVGALTPVSFTATIPGGPPALSLAFVGIPDVGVGKTAAVRATLSVPAGVGGLAVSLGSIATGTVTVAAPATVTVPQNGTTANFTVNGIAVGSTSLIATAPGYLPDTLAIVVQNRAISVPATLNVPFGQTAQLPINIGSPAPVGGVVITVSSSDSTKVAVQTPTVTIPAGGTTANAVLQGRLPGTASVTVDNPAYTSDVSTVTTSASINIIETSINPNASFPSGINLRFESNGTGIAAPAGGIAITLTSRNPACAAVPPSRTILAGQVTTTDSVSAATGPFPCNTFVVATAANLQADSVAVTVSPIPGINATAKVTTGVGLQVQTSASLGASNHGGVTVRVSSTDSSRVLIAPNPTTAGKGFIDIPITPGGTSFSWTVQVLDTVTPATLVPMTITAPGFSNGTTVDSVAPQAMDILFLPTTATVFNPNSAFQARLGTPAFNVQGVPTSLSTEQARRFGAPAESVTVVNDSVAVAALVTSQGTGNSVKIAIQPGQARSGSPASAGGVEFKPIGPGVTTVHASIPGVLSIPQPNPNYPVTVSAPAITLSTVPTLGSGLMVGTNAFLGASNHGGVTVHLAVSDSTRFRLTRATTDTAAHGTLDIAVLNGGTTISYVVQALEGQTGTATVTASAPGFTPGTTAAFSAVTPGTDVLFLPTTTTSLAPNSAFQIRVGVPNVNNTALQSEQSLRAGGPGVTATVAHSNPAAGKLFTTALTADTVTVNIAQQTARSPSPASNGGVEYDPAAAGVDSVSASIPGFISVPQPTPKYPITVTGQAITLSALPTLGSGMMVSSNGFLGASSYGVDTIHLVVTDSSKFLLAPNTTTAATGSLDIVMTAPNTTFGFTLQALEGQTGSDSIIATSKTGKFTRAATPITAVQPGFDILFLNTSQTVFQPDNAFQIRVGVPNGTNTGLVAEQALRFGSPGVTAAISSSAPNVGALVTTLGSGGTANVPITAGLARSPGGGETVAGGVSFHPSIGGTTTVSALIPGFATQTTSSVVVNVSSPAATLSAVPTMGSGLMVSVSAFLGASNHPLDTLHLVVSDSTKFLIAPNTTTTPHGTLDIPMANGVSSTTYTVHALEGQTGTATVTASASGFTNGTTTLTSVQPGFDILFLNPNTTTSQPANAFQIRLGVPNTTNTGLQSEMALRFGATPVTVAVNNTNPAVGQLLFKTGAGQSGTVAIQPGTARSPSDTAASGVDFRAIGVGTTTVIANIAGYVPQPQDTQRVTVTLPAISVSQATVGSGLQVASSVSLGAAQHGGVTVHLSSDNPALLFAHSITDSGRATLDTNLTNGTASFSYFVQGLEGATGRATVTATITGAGAGRFTDGTVQDSVAAPAADIIFLPTSISATAASVNFVVRLGIPDALGNSLSAEQALRATAATVVATVNNSNPAAAQLVTGAGAGQTGTVSIVGGQARSPGSGSGGIQFDPLAQGATAVSIQGIAGMSNLRIIPSSTVNVTVGP
jgi:adhesin/invasin